MTTAVWGPSALRRQQVLGDLRTDLERVRRHARERRTHRRLMRAVQGFVSAR